MCDLVLIPALLLGPSLSFTEYLLHKCLPAANLSPQVHRLPAQKPDSPILLFNAGDTETSHWDPMETQCVCA